MIILFGGDSVRTFFFLRLSMRFAELEFSVKWLRSSAVFGGRLKRPSPCRIRSAPRRERGRMPSETSEKLQKYRKSRRNSRPLGCVLNVCSAWIRFTKLASFPNQTVRDNVWNFAVAYSRALVSLLYFFTSSFGFLLGILLFLFLLVLPAGNSIF